MRMQNLGGQTKSIMVFSEMTYVLTWPPVTSVINETVKHTLHLCHTPVAREYVGHTRTYTRKFHVHNLHAMPDQLIVY